MIVLRWSARCTRTSRHPGDDPLPVRRPRHRDGGCWYGDGSTTRRADSHSTVLSPRFLQEGLDKTVRTFALVNVGTLVIRV